MARSSLACSRTSISEISSSSSVPPEASSNLPMRRATAPVKAPFSWPNNSDSSSASGMAAQLTEMKGLAARREWACTYLAMTSLPVPLSPVMRMEASEPAIWSAMRTTRSMAGSRNRNSELSRATAAMTAAISSASGGRGIYSLAPARMALTAAAALASTPQATTGTAMRSASSPAISPAMSIITSTSSRSAPRPARSAASAMSTDGAWATLAPPSMAIRVARLNWPSRAPTMSKRMFPAPLLRLDDFGHGDAEPVLHQHDFPTRHQAVVDETRDGFPHLPVEFDHRAGIELEQGRDRHLGAAQHHRHPHRHVEHGLEVGGAALDMGLAARVARGGGHFVQVEAFGGH